MVSLLLFSNRRLDLGVQFALLWIMISPAAAALVGKPLQDLSTAEMLVLNNDLALARRYLHPSIYSPHISSKLRSRFYYVKGYTFMKEGDYLETKTRNPIIIGEKLADRLSVDVRSKIVLNFQDVDGNLAAAAFRVVGIFKSPNSNFDQSNVFVPAETINELMNKGFRASLRSAP